MKDINLTTIRHELQIDAKAVGIPSGAANIFIDHAIDSAIKSLSKRSIITANDLKRALAKELQKYHPDLAYVYQNRDKII